VQRYLLPVLRSRLLIVLLGISLGLGLRAIFPPAAPPKPKLSSEEVDDEFQHGAGPKVESDGAASRDSGGTP
jgi:hypothetical protein